jgi:hypothetical protein
VLSLAVETAASRVKQERRRLAGRVVRVLRFGGCRSDEIRRPRSCGCSANGSERLRFPGPLQDPVGGRAGHSQLVRRIRAMSANQALTDPSTGKQLAVVASGQSRTWATGRVARSRTLV